MTFWPIRRLSDFTRGFSSVSKDAASKETSLADERTTFCPTWSRPPHAGHSPNRSPRSVTTEAEGVGCGPLHAQKSSARSQWTLDVFRDSKSPNVLDELSCSQLSLLLSPRLPRLVCIVDLQHSPNDPRSTFNRLKLSSPRPRSETRRTALVKCMMDPSQGNAVAGPSRLPYDAVAYQQQAPTPANPPAPPALPVVDPAPTTAAPPAAAPAAGGSARGPIIIPTVLGADGINELPQQFENCQVDDLITLIGELAEDLRSREAC